MLKTSSVALLKRVLAIKELFRDEEPTFFPLDPDPAQLEKKSGSDLNSKWRIKIYLYYR